MKYQGPKLLYFCVDENGTECCFTERPKRSVKNSKGTRYWYSDWDTGFAIPKGAIQLITGIIATWETGPIKWEPSKIIITFNKSH